MVKTARDVWRDTFWGRIRVPKRLGEAKVTVLAYIAWKGGWYEEDFAASFSKWFRSFAKRRPDLARVRSFRVYPVDEFQWTGQYQESLYEDVEDGEVRPWEDPEEHRWPSGIRRG